MLLMTLLAFSGAMKAAVTDLPVLTTSADDIKWYTIKNVRSGKYATYAGDNATMTQQDAASAAAFFYFTSGTTEEGVKIHNYAAGNKLCAAYNSWTEAGIDWYLHAQSTGVSISNTAAPSGTNTSWNDAGGGGQLIEYWSAGDAGSAWEISLVTDFTAIIDVPAAKEAAKAELDKLASISAIYIYPDVTVAKANVDAVEPTGTGIAELNAAIEAINGIVATYKASVERVSVEGKYFTIKTPARDNGYMEMSSASVVGSAKASSPANIWQFVDVEGKEGYVNIYNPYTKKYLCEPQGNSVNVAVTSVAAEAGNYILAVNSEDADSDNAILKFTSNGKSVHMNGGGTLVRWDNGGASEWLVAELDDFTEIINLYKAASCSLFDTWQTVFALNTEHVNEAKDIINNIDGTDWETFATIDEKVKEGATKAFNGKKYTFQTTATDAGRTRVWIAANEDHAIGADKQDQNAIWTLIPADWSTVNHSFYIYNEDSKLYMGTTSAPADNIPCPLKENPDAAYTFEIVSTDDNICVVEMKSEGTTVHASNQTGDHLINYDNNEAASRWYIEDYRPITAGMYRIVSANAGFVKEDEAYKDFKGIRGISVYGYDTEYSVHRTPAWVPVDENDPLQYWTLEENGDGFSIKASFEGNYLNKNTTILMNQDPQSATFNNLGQRQYHITLGEGDPLHCNRHGANKLAGELITWNEGVDSPSAWKLVAVSEEPEFALDLAVSTVGYATLMLAYNATIPSGVTCYTAAVDGNVAKLTAIEGNVLPANTPVIVEANEGTYSFNSTSENVAAVGKNQLAGTLYSKYITPDANTTCYVLANGDKGVGLYKAALNVNTDTSNDGTAEEPVVTYESFLNNANKVYLPVTVNPSNAAPMFSFDRGEGTTGIENSELTTQNSPLIYDLLGRRVEKMEKGIYIVNGKKVIR